MRNVNFIYYIKIAKHNVMCQFINGNNVYGSKVVTHTIIKPLIIFGNYMP